MGNNAYVYFMANKTREALYVGVTNDLERLVWEHKNNINENNFTSKYNCHMFVYYEHTSDIRAAIAREKQLKNWKREWKDDLIKKQNFQWLDLSDSIDKITDS